MKACTTEKILKIIEGMLSLLVVQWYFLQNRMELIAWEKIICLDIMVQKFWCGFDENNNIVFKSKKTAEKGEKVEKRL